MFNVGGGELLVILLVALIVLGPQRLPDAARQVGRVMGDIRRISNGFQQELKDAFDSDDSAPARRTESVPLAKAVADADDRPDPRPASRADTPARPLRDVSAPADAPTDVAPAVADALDEIVAPSPSPAASSPEPVGDAAPSAADPAPGTGAEPTAGPDGLGDERAAS
jgi:sec-independent protein translocase protein TatB